MLNNLKQTIPAFEKLKFTVGGDGEVVVIVEGDFPDPEKLSGLEVFQIIDHPYFFSVLKKAAEIATGPLSEAFDRTIREDREIFVEFQKQAAAA